MSYYFFYSNRYIHEDCKQSRSNFEQTHKAYHIVCKSYNELGRGLDAITISRSPNAKQKTG
ncbi:hypothetical protein HYC85_003256 [Camellia sinensis]|uniref:Uncharacterized protein n=1 Tax=Camellia sinensis TaxID=4442 RepID=A0A7J7IBU3_CAMSI|nr:hypothetical protein HYC85_003256 [Camellia sinensis]